MKEAGKTGIKKPCRLYRSSTRHFSMSPETNTLELIVHAQPAVGFITFSSLTYELLLNSPIMVSSLFLAANLIQRCNAPTAWAGCAGRHRIITL